MLTQTELALIKTRVERATPGVWILQDDNRSIRDHNDQYVAEVYCEDDDAEFIAHAREDIPKLIAEIERLQAERHRVYADGYAQGRFDERIEREEERPRFRMDSSGNLTRI